MLIYCYVFTVSSNFELSLFPSTHRQLQHCDGYNLFTNRPSHPEEEWKSNEEKRKSIGDGSILWVTNRTVGQGKNMRGLSAVWDLLLSPTFPHPDNLPIDVKVHEPLHDWNNVSQWRNSSTRIQTVLPFFNFDWTINLEVDHYLRASKLRYALSRYESRVPTVRDLPTIIEWKNIFIFNRNMAIAMRSELHAGSYTQCYRSQMCPHCNCAQDEFFPKIKHHMKLHPDILHLSSSVIQNGHICEMALFDFTANYRSAGGHYAYGPIGGIDGPDPFTAMVKFVKRYASFIDDETKPQCTIHTTLPDRDAVSFHNVGVPDIQRLMEELVGF